MYFKRAAKPLVSVILCAWLPVTMAAQAEKVNTLPATASAAMEPAPKAATGTQPVLSVQPATCVALHQGRTCFAQLSLNWQTSGAGDFCIYLKDDKQPVRCWQNSQGNLLSFEFESNKKVVFQLIEQGKQHVVAETSVDVSWVHKAAPRKRRWRLF
ncbi:DUF3019 domain-containing protein [Thalassomonas viridans]|uniref:DUF3019 domain-containing protein n=1 Tax=Thalassomonas viridans TaxID=137584 RepID=A0AAE9Z6I0_9GAMM|nr:DUF3019 domain-containing protein [Thalassomonas viridans]WDE05987.1 DUF3019 domain-containing protein [Thalassomonas viridans]